MPCLEDAAQSKPLRLTTSAVQWSQVFLDGHHTVPSYAISESPSLSPSSVHCPTKNLSHNEFVPPSRKVLRQEDFNQLQSSWLRKRVLLIRPLATALELPGRPRG